MAYIHTSRGSATSSRGFVGSVAGLFAKTWAAYHAARQRRAAVAALHALDDRSLKDIGLHRSEIEWTIYGRDRE